MISPYGNEYSLIESSSEVNVSRHESFSSDLDEYFGDSDVFTEINALTELFKARDYSMLRSEYNDHELTKNLKGYRSLHLFWRTERDVILVYKKHRNGDHVAFHRIGGHEWVYSPDYEKMDKERRMRKR